MARIVDREKKKLLIMEKAMTVFARKGWAETKMDEIAGAAGVGKGTVYEYFPSKTALFLACMDAVMGRAGAMIESRTAGISDPLLRLEVMIQSWKELFRGEIGHSLNIIIHIWAECIQQQEGLASRSLRAFYAEYRRMVREVLEEGIAQGRFKPVDTTSAASLIIGMFDGILLQWITEPDLFDIDTFFETAGGVIFAGLVPREKDTSPEGDAI
jgi:AcrR family transcriptional regulator